MQFSLKFLAFAATFLSMAEATCRSSGPGSQTFDGSSGCIQGKGFDHKCPDNTAFFSCCSNSNCT
ncbi:uncharacterized protein CTRU02_213391 [Colletotrichum truncatum]|uniref:Uncharacterized protein n=1 Tax=Colletotrichum truncatum TaxID=5467 RepID=A0ACC3YKK7_COLTU|nr:uncharacterized protein CTRU02_13391 [Colletotrichum truncatum]KAF6783401.1 hypothetical protein CTRU02_13391 [Colletotrichum truncatum]